MKHLFNLKVEFILICFLCFSCKTTSSSINQMTPDKLSNNSSISSSKKDIKTEKEVEYIVKAGENPDLVCNNNKDTVTNEFIKDKSTGKIWRFPNIAKTWEEALKYCNNLKVNNIPLTLPKIDELVTLYKHNCTYTSNSYLWSTTLHYSNHDWVYVFMRHKDNNNYYYSYPKQKTLPFFCVSEK